VAQVRQQRGGEKLSFPTPYKFTTKTKRRLATPPPRHTALNCLAIFAFAKTGKCGCLPPRPSFRGPHPQTPIVSTLFFVWSRGRTENRSTLFLAALPVPDMKILPPISIEGRRLLPSRWDLLAAVLVLGFIVAFADVSRFLVHPLSSITGHDLVLHPADLPGYALRTALRMLIAMGVSLAFTFTYATWAAKNPRAGTLLVPLLDILQSVPILSFLSVTVVWFLSLSPGRILGAELACVFTIFTGQAWNMAFSFYQSLRTVPPELEDAGRMFGLNAWARFWRIEAPFAMPSLV